MPRGALLIVVLLATACSNGDPPRRDDAPPDASAPVATSDARTTNDGGPDAARDSSDAETRHDAAADAAPANPIVDAARPPPLILDAAPIVWQPGLLAALPPVSFPAENPYSDAKADLGKILFWDEQLSQDDSTACGSCHRPGAGGSDPRSVTARHPGRDGVLGTDDDPHGAQGIARCTTDGAGAPVFIDDPIFGTGPQVTRRRPPNYLDAHLFPELFWDGRATSTFLDPADIQYTVIASGGALESQVGGPLLAVGEMACEGRTWDTIITKLEQVTPLVLAREIPVPLQTALGSSPTYPELFERAFGDRTITPARISMAIATHERTLVADQTPWDLWNAGDADAMTPVDLDGFAVFMREAGCANCHRPPFFTDGIFHNLGFVAESWDTGRAEVTGDTIDAGRFKTPGLRNVALREPGGLLHDGAGHGQTLDALVVAYGTEGGKATNTSMWMRSFTLTETQTMALLTFLRHAITDPRVRDETPPFDRPTLASEP